MSRGNGRRGDRTEHGDQPGVRVSLTVAGDQVDNLRDTIWALIWDSVVVIRAVAGACTWQPGTQKAIKLMARWAVLQHDRPAPLLFGLGATGVEGERPGACA